MADTAIDLDPAEQERREAAWALIEERDYIEEAIRNSLERIHEEKLNSPGGAHMERARVAKIAARAAFHYVFQAVSTYYPDLTNYLNTDLPGEVVL